VHEFGQQSGGDGPFVAEQAGGRLLESRSAKKGKTDGKIHTFFTAKKWSTIESLIGHQHPLNSNLIKNSEAEFCLVEMLDCSLIVYHPYRTLLQFRNVRCYFWTIKKG
jgi:hypothetical protein